MLFRFVKNNLLAKPLRNILVIISTSVSIILMLMMVNVYNQVQNQFDGSYSKYNVVLGATGSATELVLDSVFFSGAPENTIEYSYYEELVATNKYLLAPLTMGDSVGGYNIIGTIDSFLKDYKLLEGESLGEFAQHKDQDGEIYPVAVLGYNAYSKLGYSLGDKFSGSHAHHEQDATLSEEGQHHESFQYTVVGVLAKTNTATDNAVFVHNEAVWSVHSESHEEHEEHEEHEHFESEGKLSAILIGVGGNEYFNLLNSDRYFNDPNVMVVSVGSTLGNVQSLFGSAGGIVLAVVIVVIIISFNMLFLSMFTSASERKRDVAILRALGCNRNKILATIILEALIIILTASVIGFLFSFLGMAIIGGVFTEMIGVNVVATALFIEELYIILAAIAVGIVATLIPAFMVYKTEPSKYLR